VIGGPRCVVGLDVGSAKTCAVAVELGGAGQIELCRVLGVGVSATEGVRNRVVTNIEATTESIRQAVRDAELMAGREMEDLFVGVAGDHIAMEHSTGVAAVSGREVSARNVDQVHEVARAVVLPPDRELLHVIPQDYSVDGRSGIQDPIGMEGTRLECDVLILTAAAAPSRNLRKAVDRAGYRTAELVLAPLASSLAVLGENEREAGVALVEMGAAGTDVIVFREGKLHLLTSVAWGGGAVSNDIVKGLGVPVEEAERLKETFGAASTSAIDPADSVEVPGPMPGATRRVSRELLTHIIEQRLDEIFGLVYNRLDEANLLDDLQGGIVLSGGGVTLPGTLELAQGVFNLPVRLGEPGIGLDGLVDAVRPPKFATGVGLALYGRQRSAPAGRAGRALKQLGAWLRDFF